MPTSDLSKTRQMWCGVVMACGLWLAAVCGPASAAPRFTSAEDALRQGISAYNGGYHEIAIPALEYAASENLFLGSYYLAVLYADSNSAYTDHGKAYMVYQRIVNEHSDVDPDHDARGPYVARSLTALAKYVREGLQELRLRPNPELAAEYLHHAAVFFNDEDAQFELSKMQLNGDGVPTDVARGRHWLAVLAENGHAGAQAFLADLYWRGKFMPKDAVRALTLISVAVKNAPAGEQVWIDDIYQNIYCGAPQGVREQATGMVADWDVRYGRKPPLPGRLGLGGFDLGVHRTCADGRSIPMRSGELPLIADPAGVGATAATSEPAMSVEALPANPATGFIRGGAVGGGSMRPVGARQ